MRTAIAILSLALGLLPLYGEEQPQWASLPVWADQPPVSVEPESAEAPEEAQQPDQIIDSTSVVRPQQVVEAEGAEDPDQTIPSEGTIQSYSSHYPVHWQAPFVLANILRTAGVESLQPSISAWSPLGIELRQIEQPDFEYVVNPTYRESLTDILMRIRLAQERNERFGR